MKAIKVAIPTSFLALPIAGLLALLALSVAVAHAQCPYDDYYASPMSRPPPAPWCCPSPPRSTATPSR